MNTVLHAITLNFLDITPSHGLLVKQETKPETVKGNHRIALAPAGNNKPTHFKSV